MKIEYSIWLGKFSSAWAERLILTPILQPLDDNEFDLDFYTGDGMVASIASQDIKRLNVKLRVKFVE